MVSTTHAALEHYLALPYRIELVPDDDGWFVRMPDLPGCISQGDTEEEAQEMIRDAQRGWIAERLERGLPIPPPHAESAHHFTGKFNVRVPRDLHRALVAVAEEQAVSLNLFVATALQDVVTRATERRGSPSDARGQAPAYGVEDDFTAEAGASQRPAEASAGAPQRTSSGPGVNESSG